MCDMERSEGGRTFGFAAEFARKGNLIRRVGRGLAPSGEYLVVESASGSGPVGDLRSIKKVNALEIENRGDEPQVTGTQIEVEPTEVVEFVGRFEIDVK